MVWDAGIEKIPRTVRVMTRATSFFSKCLPEVRNVNLKVFCRKGWQVQDGVGMWLESYLRPQRSGELLLMLYWRVKYISWGGCRRNLCTPDKQRLHLPFAPLLCLICTADFYLSRRSSSKTWKNEWNVYNNNNVSLHQEVLIEWWKLSETL